MYEPTGRLANTYAPFESVVVVVTDAPKTLVTAVPSALVIDMVTPAIPCSPASCSPSPSVSYQTKSPTLTLGSTKPKSRVLSLEPSTVRLEDVALPVEESVDDVPCPAWVAM